ncbi:DUF1254 domain-containing protein [Rhizobium sp. A37_96]
MEMNRRDVLKSSVTALISLPLLAAPADAANKVSASDHQRIRELARQAYIYALPMVENYYTIYQYAIDKGNPQYKAPFNQFGNVSRVFTPDDTSIVTPNSDTPYSFLMVDLRAEPLVVTLPAIEENRYYSMQLVDLYTHNLDFLGTRKDGNGGGKFLLAGPDWQGEVPAGIKRMIRFPTQFGFALIRTQLFNPDDIDNVKTIQEQYHAAPLSRYLGVAALAAAPEIPWPVIDRESAEKDFWSYVPFLFRLAPPLKWEMDLRKQFETIGLAAGDKWPTTTLSPEVREIIRKTGQETRAEIDEGVRRLTTSIGLFGTPDKMRDKYWERALGAKGGIYGNDVEETVYPIIPFDNKGERLDASRHNYIMRFVDGKFPPVDAFWSLTVYDGPTKLLVHNPIGRYLINSTMEKQLQKNADGDIILYIQKESPGTDLESNWLPAANGPINLVMRLYLPRKEVLTGEWIRPDLEQNG